MRRYNARDVELLERVYEKLKPWATNHPEPHALYGAMVARLVNRQTSECADELRKVRRSAADALQGLRRVILGKHCQMRSEHEAEEKDQTASASVFSKDSWRRVG
jgi:hypothetical protein